MSLSPTWALVVSDALRYFSLRPWHPRISLRGRAEPLAHRVKRLRKAWAGSRLADAERVHQSIDTLLAAAVRKADLKRPPSQEVCGALRQLGIELAAQNDYVLDFPKIELKRSLTALEAEEITERLIEIQTRVDHDGRIADLFSRGLSALYVQLLQALPAAAVHDDSAPFRVHLYSLFDDPADLVARLFGTFLQDLLPEMPDAIAALAFMHTRRRLMQNLLDISRLTPEQFEVAPHKIIFPKASDLAPPEMVAAYLAGTPFPRYLDTQVAFAIPMELRPEHALVVAASGTGKTQLLQHDIFTNLQLDDPPGMVVIDSQGQMLKKIERLECFHPQTGRLKDRLVIVDPEHDEPALNMFAVPERISAYDRLTRESIEASTIQTMNLIFAGLAQELTGLQTTLFSYVSRLMFSIPGATIHTLLDFIEDNSRSLAQSPFKDDIGKLDARAQSFFENQYFQGRFNATRQQVASRLYGVVRIPAFDRMFGSAENKLDLFTELNRGAIVLFNTSKKLLADDASSLFGRFAIASAIRAMFERESLREQSRPALLYIDEAADYFKDATLNTLLTQVRKYNMGALIAFQNLDQLKDLRQVVIANTSIKLCAGLSFNDARILAHDMRTTPEMLLALKKHERASEFACYLRNQTPHALRLTVPFLTVENAPKMDEAAYVELRRVNRQRVAAAPVSLSKTPSPAPSPPVGDPSRPASEW